MSRVPVSTAAICQMPARECRSAADPLRGLFHSDGWRGHNVAVHRAPDGFVTRYRYPRYEFTTRSADIRAICTAALDLLDIAWRPNAQIRVGVARRGAVAALDEHVGPKH